MSTILAMDISARSTGWSVIKSGRVSKKRLGLIKINSNLPMGKRLQLFEWNIKEIIKKYDPGIIVIEDVFKGRNAKTFKILSLFRGVAIKAVYDEIGKDPVSIMAAQVRRLIDLPNDKEAVFKALNTKYKLGFDFKKDNDIVDAIALALACHKIRKQGKNAKSL